MAPIIYLEWYVYLIDTRALRWSCLAYLLHFLCYAVEGIFLNQFFQIFFMVWENCLLVYHKTASKCIFKDFLHYYVKPEYVVDLHTNTVHLTYHSSFFFSWSVGFYYSVIWITLNLISRVYFYCTLELGILLLMLYCLFILSK